MKKVLAVATELAAKAQPKKTLTQTVTELAAKAKTSTKPKKASSLKPEELIKRIMIAVLPHGVRYKYGSCKIKTNDIDFSVTLVGSKLSMSAINAVKFGLASLASGKFTFKGKMAEGSKQFELNVSGLKISSPATKSRLRQIASDIKAIPPKAAPKPKKTGMAAIFETARDNLLDMENTALDKLIKKFDKWFGWSEDGEGASIEKALASTSKKEKVDLLLSGDPIAAEGGELDFLVKHKILKKSQIKSELGD